MIRPFKFFREIKEENPYIRLNWVDVEFVPGDLQKIDPQSGIFIFMNKEGMALTLTKIVEKSYHYMDAF